MGLDISYYESAKPAPGVDPDDLDDFCQVHADPAFPGRLEGLEDGGVYEVGEGGGFRAGSYSGYNNWREQLAKMVGYPAVESEGPRHSHSAGAWAADGGPFWELIHFTDCDGTIGPVVSAKLAKDFTEHQAAADAHPDDWFRAKYADWRTAFETAAKGGMVDFH